MIKLLIVYNKCGINAKVILNAPLLFDNDIIYSNSSQFDDPWNKIFEINACILETVLISCSFVLNHFEPWIEIWIEGASPIAAFEYAKAFRRYGFVHWIFLVVENRR